MEVHEPSEDHDRQKLSVNDLCKQRRCVWCGAMYDSQWACISCWLTGSLSPSSRRTTEAFYPHTYPPADLLFMLCGLAIDLWQDQCSGRYGGCPKERQMEESGLAPDGPCTHLITATSYQRTLICQPHTTYSSDSSLCFFPSPDQYINLSHLQTPPLFGFRSKSLSACFPQSLPFPDSFSLYHFLFGFKHFTRDVVIVSTLSPPHPTPTPLLLYRIQINLTHSAYMSLAPCTLICFQAFLFL